MGRPAAAGGAVPGVEHGPGRGLGAPLRLRLLRGWLHSSSWMLLQLRLVIPPAAWAS